MTIDGIETICDIVGVAIFKFLKAFID